MSRTKRRFKNGSGTPTCHGIVCHCLCHEVCYGGHDDPDCASRKGKPLDVLVPMVNGEPGCSRD